MHVDNAHWTPWEELPFPIEAPEVLPIVANRRLMLLWPKIEMRADEPTEAQRQANLPPAQVRRVTLMWAELREGEWSEVKMSAASMRILPAERDPDAGAESSDRHWDITLTAEVKAEKIEVRLVRNNIVNKNGKLEARWRHSFVFDACRGTFEVSDGDSYMSEPAFGSDSLKGDYPVPFMSMGWHQGFRSPPGAALSSHVRIPVPQAAGQPFTFARPFIEPVSSFALTLARQEHTLNGHRPFVFSDNDVILYIRYDDAADVTDLNPNSHSLKALGTITMAPYMSHTNGQVPVPLTVENKFALQTLSGGENAATMQMWDVDLKDAPEPPEYRVSLLYHPHACLFLQQVRRFGVPGLLAPDVAAYDPASSLLYQATSSELPAGYFTGIEAVHKPVPPRNIDFLYGGAYSVYNWELFYHIPMYIADRLMAERRFAEAQRWLGYIFNPLTPPGQVEDATDCRYYWRIKPFREATGKMSIEDLMELLHSSDKALETKKMELEAQIAAWCADPFRPHLVARLRPTAYMRAVVMKYLDNLIAWGDDLFRQDTRESTQEAVQLYMLALGLLGKRPRKIDRAEHADKSFAEAADLDSFSNFMVAIENEVIVLSGKDLALPLDLKAQADHQLKTPDVFQIAYVPPSKGSLVIGNLKAKPPKPKSSFNPLPLGVADADPVEMELYFCLPPNDRLLAYWDTVADRLFKLRNCLNLDGLRRDLALFDPPIDPALLAKAAAQGIDLSTAISNLYAPLPNYRFLVHLGIAKDFAAQVSGLGSALLQALEKRDAEALANLRATHELIVMKSARGLRERAIEEAQENVAALEGSKKAAQYRHSYYSSRVKINELEQSERNYMHAAKLREKLAGAFQVNSAAAGAFPNFHVGISGVAASPVSTFTVGGTTAAAILGAAGQAISVMAGTSRTNAAMQGTLASYERRKDDWDHQAGLATKDIEQIDKQISAAKQRLEIVQIELLNHDLQVEKSAEALEVMQSKFTNAELYAWMAGEISKVYNHAYQLAVDMGRRTERCYRYELGVDATDFVQFGHWDNRRQGLLAGERLSHDLRRMESAYYEKNRREYELTKRISLASLDPVALVSLRKTGACHFELPALLFALDHASHYFRRIKMVGVTVPAVTGAYTNIGVTLTFESGQVRRVVGDEPDGDGGAAQAVAISATQEDTGLFEPNLRDERYLPFEGRGIENSRWRIELPPKVRQFDYETISDIVLTVRYTAREGGSEFGGTIHDALAAGLEDIERVDPGHGTGQLRIFSARAEFPEAWRSFAATTVGDAVLTLDLSEDRFPHPQLAPGGRTIESVAIFVRWPADASAIPSPIGTVLTGVTLTAAEPTNTDYNLGAFTLYKSGLPAGDTQYNYMWSQTTSEDLGEALGTWTLTLPNLWPAGKAPEDVIVVVQHKVI